MPLAVLTAAQFDIVQKAGMQCPARTWSEIAHTFGYHDHMHMIHDFERLGLDTPAQVLIRLGDVRPAALAGSEPDSDS